MPINWRRGESSSSVVTNLSNAFLVTPNTGSNYPIRFNPPSGNVEEAKVALTRTPFIIGSGKNETITRNFIEGENIKLLDVSKAIIPEGSTTTGYDIRLSAGGVYEIYYQFGVQDLSTSTYLDISIVDSNIFDSQIANSDPSPHRLGMLNYQSDATAEAFSRSDNIRSPHGFGRINLKETGTDLDICLAAINSNNTDTKLLAWWHTSVRIKQIA